MLSFLLEFLSKSEEEDGKGETAPSQSFEVNLKRRMLKWSHKPWVVPEFLTQKKRLCIASGDVIAVRKDLDTERIAQCKSKKAKGVHAMMQVLHGNQFSERYQAGANLLGRGIQDKHTLKQALLSLNQGSSNLFQEDDD